MGINAFCAEPHKEKRIYRCSLQKLLGPNFFRYNGVENLKVSRQDIHRTQEQPRTGRCNQSLELFEVNLVFQHQLKIQKLVPGRHYQALFGHVGNRNSANQLFTKYPFSLPDRQQHAAFTFRDDTRTWSRFILSYLG